MKGNHEQVVSTEIQGKVFPWLVILLLVNTDKIALKMTNTGRHTLLKEFGGSANGLEFSYKETVEKLLYRHNISLKRSVIDEVLDVRDSYRDDLKTYKKIMVRMDASDALITKLDRYEPVGWYFPSDIFFLTMSDEDKKLIAREFGLDEKRFTKAAAV